MNANLVHVDTEHVGIVAVPAKFVPMLVRQNIIIKTMQGSRWPYACWDEPQHPSSDVDLLLATPGSFIAAR